MIEPTSRTSGDAGPTGIIWVGPVGHMGGYGSVSRNYLRCLRQL